MSSPLTALNSARSTESLPPITPVVPLVRRVQQESNLPSRGFTDDALRPDDSDDALQGQQAPPPTTLDGNLFAAPMMLPAAAQALARALVRGPRSAAPMPAQAKAKADGTASTPLPPLQRMQGLPVALAATRASAAPLHRQPLPATPAAHSLALQPLPGAAASSAMEAARATPAAHAGPAERAARSAVTAPAVPEAQRRARPAVPETSQPLQPGTEQAYTQDRTHPPADGPAHGPRQQGTLAASAHLAAARHAAASSAQRTTTVSVPFSSWGPGHQVTASWVSAGVPGQHPPTVSLRSSSDAAQQAVGDALASTDRLALGNLQISEADAADDGTPERRRARHEPEDDE